MPPLPPGQPVSWRQMLSVFGRIGLLSFGGPAAQIALMHRELVEERPWLDNETFLRALSLCMLLPGPEAMQLATYCGWRLRGRIGGLLAGTLFVLPGALVIATLVALYAAFGTVPLVQAAFTGIKAAVIIIVLQALVNIGGKALTGPTPLILPVLAFLAIFAFDLPFPLIIAAAALWGYVTTSASVGAAPPEPDRASQIPLALIGLTVWLAPLSALTLGGFSLLSDMGWFFAKLAVVTFGGAYAVLAYMTQTVVQDLGWISTAQMIDALGLAETTPGPLILVTQFVAMLTGALQGGPLLSLAAGAVALWATFVPCFLWIFLAAPHLDRLAARPRLTGALSAITAAVVGVIANLSVWFSLHVLFGEVQHFSAGPLSIPLPVLSTLDPAALLLSILAAALLIWARRGMGLTLAVMAIAGMATHFL